MSDPDTISEEVPMANRPEIAADVTPAQFFEELLPAGYEAQREEGVPLPKDLRIQYHLQGEDGGSWHVHMAGDDVTVTSGEADADLTVRLSVEDWADAIHGRGGADLVLVVPQARPGRPDNSERAKQLKGTVEIELSRDGQTFGGADQPRTTLRSKIEDYVAIQQGKLNGQEAFMTGKVRIEGDMAFMMQVAMLTS
jgi:putative sterol carrier protein